MRIPLGARALIRYRTAALVLAVVQTALPVRHQGWDIRAADRLAQQIDSSQQALRKTTHNLNGRSTEGGQLIAFWQGLEPTLFVASYYGELGKTTYRYYYSRDTVPFLIIRIEERYDQPLSGHVTERAEERLYVQSDSLWARTMNPNGAGSLLTPERGIREELETASELRRCATSTAPDC